ncbi:hypothetical protein AX17_001966 [Amanita inopinata Kibby_2008]|nr:hypothetical protein AX17_001966 [Amanita inopinata Kibby_2008]
MNPPPHSKGISLPSIHEMFPGKSHPLTLTHPHSPLLTLLLDRTSYSTRQSGDTLRYSFNVLRSNPSNSSLEHIASSASYPHKTSSSGPASLHLGAGNASTPTFRVSVPPPPPRPSTSISTPPASTSAASSLVGIGLASHLTVTLPLRQRSASDVNGDSHMSIFERGRRGSEPALAPAPTPGYTTLSFPLDDSFATSGTVSLAASSSSNGRAPEMRALTVDMADAASDDGDVSGGTAGKKHICPTCSKRFNRPSSLRIHVNTHTGATPFRCPWPNCGREFNVNSNMRRHYRNHTSPGLSRAQPVDHRRRRRRAQQTDLVFVSSEETVSASTSEVGLVGRVQEAREKRFISPTPESSVSDESADEVMPLVDGYRHVAAPSTCVRHGTHPGYSINNNNNGTRMLTSLCHTRESHLRSLTPRTSPSPPSPHLSLSSPSLMAERKYSPSTPYLRSSVTDTRVSTALRPAFHPAGERT